MLDMYILPSFAFLNGLYSKGVSSDYLTIPIRYTLYSPITMLITF